MVKSMYRCVDVPDDVEGAEIDCPDCDGEAIVTDSGVYCPDCDK